MPKATSIEWTDMTWNPVTGCTKVSQGCKNCYADRMAKRLKAMGVARYQDGFKVTMHEDLLDVPKRWREPRLVFVNSMSDLFHEKVPLSFIKRVFATMKECDRHVFQVLTKRSERLVELASKLEWPENVWMGVSVEDENVLHRVDDLRKTPAHIKFLSCEPLIGPLTRLDVNGIDWVIVGGESGPKSRPMEADWAREIRAKCEALEVPFFFKQWGGVQKHVTGRDLDGQIHNGFPVALSNQRRRDSPTVRRSKVAVFS